MKKRKTNWLPFKSTKIFEKHLHFSGGDSWKELSGTGYPQTPAGWVNAPSCPFRFMPKLRAWVCGWRPEVLSSLNYPNLLSDFEKIKLCSSIWMKKLVIAFHYCGKIVSFVHKRIASQIIWLSTMERKNYWYSMENILVVSISLIHGYRSAMPQSERYLCNWKVSSLYTDAYSF